MLKTHKIKKKCHYLFLTGINTLLHNITLMLFFKKLIFFINKFIY